MQMLTMRLSALRIHQIVERHIRLLNRFVHDEALIHQIQPHLEQLHEKIKLLEVKENLREDAYDDVVIADLRSGYTVRNLFADCEVFDRSNPSDRILNRIFPSGTFGSLVRLPFEKEMLELEKLVRRLKELGDNHTLNHHISLLNKQITEFELAIKNNKAAITAVKMAEEEVQVSKRAIIQAYEMNYLDARKKYGKIESNILFPKFFREKKADK